MSKVQKTFKIKHHEIEITKDSPFLKCELGREKYARVLTDLFSTDSEGYVLALNNKWGTGKTTFLRMWNQLLLKEGFATVMFNAWETDYVSNPLTALIAELKSLDHKNSKDFESVLNAAAKISKGFVPALVKALASKYIETEVLVDFVKDAVDSISDFKEEVEQYEKQKKSIVSFKSSLSKFVSSNSNGKPIVFLIDELDRCRPNYAVSILESIKHLFSVPNVIFVLSIDKTQLEGAICGVYGTEKIDSVEYLRKFIDIEYSLPKPVPELYLKYLYQYYDFDLFFRSQPKNFGAVANNDRRHFVEIITLLLTRLTLRQQEKIMGHLRLSFMSTSSNFSFFPLVYVFLMYCKTVEHELYDLILSKSITTLKLQEKVYDLFKDELNEGNSSILVYLEGYLLTGYTLYAEGKNTIFEFAVGKIVTGHTSKFSGDSFEHVFHEIATNYGRNPVQLNVGKIISNIELLDDIVLIK